MLPFLIFLTFPQNTVSIIIFYRFSVIVQNAEVNCTTHVLHNSVAATESVPVCDAQTLVMVYTPNMNLKS